MKFYLRPILRTTIVLYTTLGCALLAAKEPSALSAPRLTGTLNVDITIGVVRANLCLDQLPSGVKAFAINRGMNIRDFRAKSTGELIDFGIDSSSEVASDATRYELSGDVPSQGVCTTYAGAFPVYAIDKGERAINDWKGFIAFDGRSVRAADQSRFYPAPVLPTEGELGALRYDVKIICAGCQTIFWNGSPPAKGPEASFKSDVPRNLFLYAGDFPAQQVAGANFVGVSILPEDAADLSQGIKRIADIHQLYLGVPYSEPPSFVSFASVSRTRAIGKTSWQFVTWPTIAADGMLPFASFIDRTAGKGRLTRGMEKLLSHEMAHYYFGTRYQPQGSLQWFLLESTAEFMSLKALKTLRDESAYTNKIKEYADEIAKRNDFVLLNNVTKAEEIDVTYRYRLGPLLLIGLEKWTSKETVQRLLAGLVTNPPVGAVDYPTFRSRLTQAGASQMGIAQFEANCLVKSVSAACWN